MKVGQLKAKIFPIVTNHPKNDRTLTIFATLICPTRKSNILLLVLILLTLLDELGQHYQILDDLGKNAILFNSHSKL